MQCPISKFYPTLTPLPHHILLEPILPYPGGLRKIRPKCPTKFGRNDPGRNYLDRNDPGPKRLRAEMTQGRNNPNSVLLCLRKVVVPKQKWKSTNGRGKRFFKTPLSSCDRMHNYSSPIHCCFFTRDTNR